MIEFALFIFAIFVFFNIIKITIQLFWQIVTPIASFCALLIIAYFFLSLLGAVHA